MTLSEAMTDLTAQMAIEATPGSPTWVRKDVRRGE